MYHPKYKVPKKTLTYEQKLGPIDEESIFRPPEGEEWIEVYSDKKTPKKEETKNRARDKQIDPNPFKVSQMGPYHENIEYSTTSKIYTPEDNTRRGELPREFQSDINQWQQGFMSIGEVAGEPTTSGDVDPNYRIPKLSKKKVLISDKLNQLASNISPPAKERKKQTSSTTQPHKNKKTTIDL